DPARPDGRRHQDRRSGRQAGELNAMPAKPSPPPPPPAAPAPVSPLLRPVFPSSERVVGALQTALAALAVPVLAVVTALLVGGAIIALAGRDPLLAYAALWEGCCASPRALSETL